MSKVVETKYGRVAFVESATYFNGDLMHGSIGVSPRRQALSTFFCWATR